VRYFENPCCNKQRNFQKNGSGKNGEILRTSAESRIERTRDCIQINCGGEKGIVILVTPESIELRLPTVEWTCVYGPAASSRFWKRVNESEITDE